MQRIHGIHMIGQFLGSAAFETRITGGFKGWTQHFLSERKFPWPRQASPQPHGSRSPFWDQIRAGHYVEDAATLVGASFTAGRRWFRKRGGMKPCTNYGHRPSHLDLDEREEIAWYRAQNLGIREIARRAGRNPSTISRELKRTPRDPSAVRPRRPTYHPRRVKADADAKAKRPKPRKLGTRLAPHREVQSRLKLNRSPKQIAK